jgi:hypothetical protein
LDVILEPGPNLRASDVLVEGVKDMSVDGGGSLGNDNIGKKGVKE